MKTREQILEDFDPNGVGVHGSLFGLPFTPEMAGLVIIPVPYEVTVSYREGTAGGPKAILEASTQVDLLDGDIREAWKLGIAMLPLSRDMELESEQLREKASSYIEWLEAGKPEDMKGEMAGIPAEVDKLSAQMVSWVKGKALEWIRKGKMVAVLGGDHSTPLGLINALAGEYDNYSILQIDAHMDLRKAYEGFEFSHASIMHNALINKNITKLVQVGIRDYCSEEKAVVERYGGRIKTYYDQDIKTRLYDGGKWSVICDEVIADLYDNVYVSFDIDGLDPKLCPNTGTPVPGGVDFNEAMYLIRKLVESGRTVIGFDLCEVAPGDHEWDGNVGARVLYRLANLMAVSQGKLSFR